MFWCLPPQRRVDGFIAAGHVCTIMGTREYEPLVQKYQVPIVVAGFEPVDLLQAIHMLVKQLEEGRYAVENQYERLVRAEGNRPAQELIQQVFEVRDRAWRGIGNIPKEYADYDAELRFEVQDVGGPESAECLSGLVLQGIIKPHECPAFGTTCTPDNPLGATMVSNEGACAAYYRYRRHEKK
jgi:hydrogenase expression/formation protein HypD